ncbi:hypothetical protein MMC29_004990 [Sticta canariensis]|nr:hypothetical protein [Sticta canariensis]
MEARRGSHSLEGLVRLETIDKLFEYNIGDPVALPQVRPQSVWKIADTLVTVIVASGGRRPIKATDFDNSGESSVLEGFTNLPFPRDSGLCTSFATQITFCRAKEQSVAVSLIFANDAATDHAEKLRTWKDDLHSLERSKFSEILKEASLSLSSFHIYSCMGLDSAGVKDEKKTFSKDVLKIEIRGPGQQDLSVIDVPGIFTKTTAGVTSKTDMTIVRNMVSCYMKNPRAATLAVIPAHVDIATQEILEMAEEHDTNGQRVLRVLTKSDLVDRGAEQKVIDLVQGKPHKLSMGWCITCPGEELSEESRALIRLREILAEIVRREFPGELEALGSSRETKEQQQKYLLDLAPRFQKITSLALDARYGGGDIFEEFEGLELATSIVRRNEKLSDDVWKKGHTIDFDQTLRESSPSPEPATSEIYAKYDSENDDENDLYKEDFADLRHKNPERMKNDQKTMPWLNQNLHQLSWLVNWDDLALGYISDVMVIVHSFISCLLQAISPDKRVLKELTSVLMEELVTRYLKATDQVKFVLRVERAGTPLTINHYFNENLEKCRQERWKSNISRNAGQLLNLAHPGKMISLDKLNLNGHMSKGDHTIHDIHDILKSYYKVARKRFVDVVSMQQGADFHLATAPETPTKVFSLNFVANLKPEQLERICRETLTIRKKRAELIREISNLENGKKILI